MMWMQFSMSLYRFGGAIRKKSLPETDVSNCSGTELAVRGSSVEYKYAWIIVTLGFFTWGKE